MARVTVEDCVKKIPNRFELVIKAAQRARQISVGAAISIERDNDKNPVVALREIADETIDITNLDEATLMAFRRQFSQEELDDDGKTSTATPELTLSGDIDDTEAALEAEFEEIEQSMQVIDADSDSMEEDDEESEDELLETDADED